jgi:hypothetical protein
MRLFLGLINIFITVYNLEGINPSITDVIFLSICKFITNYIKEYNTRYFRLLNRKFITGFFRDDSRTQRQEYKILKIKYNLNVQYVC